MAKKPLGDRVTEIRDAHIQERGYAVPDEYQGVSMDRVREVLAKLDRTTENEIRAVFALLDDEHESWHSRAPKGAKFCDGASTAQIGSHVAILQQGLTIKLDREGRDYWIKPLRDVGAIEAVYPVGDEEGFMIGHPVPKSPLSSYRLEQSFREILQANDSEWEEMLDKWAGDTEVRGRLRFQAEMSAKTASLVQTKHGDLIRSCIENYVPRFLAGYTVLFTDVEDGDRITDQERALLESAGIITQADDAMPDVLLWNPDEDTLWVIEAVTSDGEVDMRKVEQMNALAQRSGKKAVGFTTAYLTWPAAASRQKRNKNVALNTYVWIHDDPAKHFLAESMGDDLTLIQTDG